MAGLPGQGRGWVPGWATQQSCDLRQHPGWVPPRTAARPGCSVGQLVGWACADGRPDRPSPGGVTVPSPSWSRPMSTPLSTTSSSTMSPAAVSSSAVSSRRWPDSPLAAAARAFELLTCEPDPLTFDARGLPVLPQRTLPLDELRDLLTA